MKKRRPDHAATAAYPVAPDAAPRQLSGLLIQASPILLVIGSWLLLHPYRGIIHDARLYAAQALRELKPEVYDRDLFFAFGSQDQFTLFTRFYAPLVDGIGLPAASFVVVLAGQILWLSGAVALAGRLAGRGPEMLAGLLLLAVLPGSYGGWQTFAFAEGFATPRLLAEALGLWALWALTGGRMFVATVFVVASGLLHPIMAMTAALVGWIFLALRDPRWLVLAVLGGLAGLAGLLLGVAPFDRALTTMDAEWLALVERRNAYLFPGLWRQTDWSRLTVMVTMALAAAALLTGWRRALVLAPAVAAMFGVGITWIGADLLHNVLLIQLQFYRAMWLLGVIAYLGAGVLLVRIWALREDGYAIVAFLAVGLFVAFTLLPTVGTALFAAGLAFAVLRSWGRLGPLPGPARAVPVLLAILLGAGLLVFRGITIARKIEAAAGGVPTEIFAVVTVIDVAVISVAVLVAARYRPRAALQAVPAVAVLLALGAVLTWDRRDTWSSVAMSHSPALPPSWSLPADTQIFWENDTTYPWFVLGRPSYVSVTQGAGIAFIRDTALAFGRRIDVVQPLMQIEMTDIYRRESAAHGELPSLDRAALTAACSRDPVLGALVLSRAVEGSYRAVWEPPVAQHDEWRAQRGIPQTPVRRYYLYRCDDLRADAPAAGG